MQNKHKTAWHNIGCHETPPNLAEEFAKLIGEYIATLSGNQSLNGELKILDIFAGDGRLGNLVSESLCDLFKSIHVTFVEIDFFRKIEIAPFISNFTIIRRNAFAWDSEEKFDLIVSNPPYLMVNAKQARDLGLSWKRVKVCLRNLYGLGIAKGLELCKDGGVLAAIAPFSWLRSVYGKDFRQDISQSCSDVCVKGNNHRSIFKGTIQDTGIQIFRKRPSDYLGPCRFRFYYYDSEIFSLGDNGFDLANYQDAKGVKVRLGPIVWNRKKEFLTADASDSMLLIYGGNIRQNGILNTRMRRYAEKQYIKMGGLHQNDVLSPPFILIRRTLRGVPGNWKIDSCLITNEVRCTAENHVIIIELKDLSSSFIDFHEQLIKELIRYYYISGSPSISANVVRMIATKLLSSSDMP